MVGNQVKDELFLLPVDGGPAQRLDPDFVGSITMTPTPTGFFATFVSYNTPGLIKRLDWTHPGTETSWKVLRDTKFKAFPLADLYSTANEARQCMQAQTTPRLDIRREMTKGIQDRQQ